MKVFLAAQIFSLSVANAIDHCRENLKIPGFEDSAATSRFLRMFNDLFDLLNSSSKFGAWSKAPLSVTNTGYWRDTFREGAAYIKGLTLASGLLVNRFNSLILPFYFCKYAETQVS